MKALLEYLTDERSQHIIAALAVIVGAIFLALIIFAGDDIWQEEDE